jgi:tripartite-type tricarboxylate transporter receptor subunit TctC
MLRFISGLATGIVLGTAMTVGGKLRALAATTATCSPVLPDIPTVAEFVPG